MRTSNRDLQSIRDLNAPNSFELRRLGSDHRQLFQHPHHTTLLANFAASQVASSEGLYGSMYFRGISSTYRYLAHIEREALLKDDRIRY